jgi:hypothetical protein
VVYREVKDGDAPGHDLRERNIIVMQGVDTMRFALVLAIGLFGLTQSASADVMDDYVACMVGKTTVAMFKQPGRKSAKAVAASQCPRPKEADSLPRMEKSFDLIFKAIADTIDQGTVQ